jgi:hypothetical protein
MSKKLTTNLTMKRKILAVLMTVTLCFTTVACGGSSNTNNTQTRTNFANNTSIPSNNISSGKYPVQQATYNDVDGEYTLMLLNTPPGSSPTYRTQNLQMARLTDEEIKNGEKTYLNINGSQAAMHLTEDFKIEYVHNVTEVQTNPNTGRQETVIVQQRSSFWTPFAGALAGQAIGSMLFRPQYYVPPVYQPGGVLTGYGGYGSTYNQAVQSYQSTYNSPPPAVKNRNSFRTTGSLKNSSNTNTKTNTNINNKTNTNTNTKTNTNTTKSTGSGFGSSNLKTNGNSSNTRQPSKKSFGTNRPSNRPSTRTPTRSRRGGFGSSRRGGRRR